MRGDLWAGGHGGRCAGWGEGVGYEQGGGGFLGGKFHVVDSRAGRGICGVELGGVLLIDDVTMGRFSLFG